MKNAWLWRDAREPCDKADEADYGPRIPAFVAGRESRFGPGVIGFSYEWQGTTYYPIVTATRPGSGDVGRWLDCLHGRVGFVEVFSERLAGMLERRGYVKAIEPVGIGGEPVSVYLKDCRVPEPVEGSET
jgi:hypothetical protein